MSDHVSRFGDLVDRLESADGKESLSEALAVILEAGCAYLGHTRAWLVRQQRDEVRTVATVGGSTLLDDGAALRFWADQAPKPGAGPAPVAAPDFVGAAAAIEMRRQPYGVLLVGTPVPAGGDPARTPLETARESVEPHSDDDLRGLYILARAVDALLTRDALESELYEAQQHLGYLTHVDPLTELPNHRGARRAFGEHTARSRFSGRPLSLAVWEVDGISEIRERWGRAAADRVLRGAASRARASLRPSDVLTRLGPARFLAILPEASLNAARAASERVVASVERLHIESPEGQPIGVAVHSGVARILQPDTTYDDVLVEIERLLDDSRQSGTIAVQAGLSVGKEV